MWRRSTSVSVALAAVTGVSSAGCHASLRENVEPRDTISARWSDVFELADIARPVVVAQRLHHVVGNRVDLPTQGAAQPLDEVPHQQRNVAAALAQGRQGDRKDIEPVVQIAAKASFAHVLGQVAIGRGDHADVDVDGPGIAEPLDLPFLQHAKQLGLDFERQLADLVEEDRALGRELEPSDLRGVGAGEGAAFATEQLALNQGGGHGRAIDHDERAATPQAASMDGAGEQFFAGTGLAAQQHRRIGGGDLVDSEHHVAERIALANDGFLLCVRV